MTAGREKDGTNADRPLAAILDGIAAPGKDAKRSDKKNFAERLSRELATLFANALRPAFPGILPDEQGRQQESRARTAKGVKKLDVNYSTPELGLGLGVSIKTLNFRDPKTNRYTKNYTRIDNELRAEAMDYHQRQPFAVMVGVVFLPADACDDGSSGESGAPSSFGQAVRIFRCRARRADPHDDAELFERLFIGLYTAEGERRGDVVFFDVESAPPRIGHPVPADTLSLAELLKAIEDVYNQRNNPPFEWAP